MYLGTQGRKGVCPPIPHPLIRYGPTSKQRDRRFACVHNILVDLRQCNVIRQPHSLGSISTNRMYFNAMQIKLLGKLLITFTIQEHHCNMLIT